MNKTSPNLIRLNKFLAQSGTVSRRKADDLIEQGAVTINGKPVTELGTKLDPETDKVTLNGKPIEPQKELIYLALNKPKGHITTLKDEFNRPTIARFIPANLKDKGLKPIGRLDKDTEGLVILTNDLELINKFTHPRYEKEKEYFVEVEGRLTPQDKAKLERGVFLPDDFRDNVRSTSKSDKKTLPCLITITVSTPKTTKLKIILKEGRKRQIRKMFKLLSLPVLYLQRIRVGHLVLNEPPLTDLELGQTKLIDKKCLQA